MSCLQTLPNLSANLGACSGISIDYLGEFGGFAALHTIVVRLLLVDLVRANFKRQQYFPILTSCFMIV